VSDGTPLTSPRAPQLHARVAGLLYLYIIAAGTFAEVFVRGRLVVPSDPVATARNIVANELLFRRAFSAEFLHLACDVVVTAILYMLLRPVNGTIARITAWMRLACIIVLATVGVAQMAALRLVTSPGNEQFSALASLAMQLHHDGYAVSLVFFGFGCLTAGYLIFRSTYLPRTIGVLMAIAGACYVVNSFGRFLDAAFVSALFPALFIPIFIAELALSVWLVVKGVHAGNWEKATRLTAASG
jgi:Domain of unknown function (DUF4386)